MFWKDTGLLWSMFMLLSACRTGRPEVSGLFYSVHLDGMPRENICQKLGDSLTDKLELHTLHNQLPVGAARCLIQLENSALNPRAIISIASIPSQNRISMGIQASNGTRVVEPSAATRDFAKQVVEQIRAELPESEIETVKPRYGLFAP
jgi:hypothetical protein